MIQYRIYEIKTNTKSVETLYNVYTSKKPVLIEVELGNNPWVKSMEEALELIDTKGVPYVEYTVLPVISTTD